VTIVLKRSKISKKGRAKAAYNARFRPLTLARVLPPRDFSSAMTAAALYDMRSTPMPEYFPASSTDRAPSSNNTPLRFFLRCLADS
jgi:hypothetical protein